jgi:hypothetical protein
MLSKSHFLLVGLIASGTALAQVPPPPPAGAPFRPGAAPAAVPQLPNDPAALAQKVKQDGFLEPKINGERLAELYTELTGRRVTVSNAAISAEFRFVQQGPITYGQAAELLKVAAVLEGFVFVPSGENHDKLVYSQNQAQATSQDLPVFTDPADLPEGEQVVTYVMPLKHIKPDEVVRAFTAVEAVWQLRLGGSGAECRFGDHHRKHLADPPLDRASGCHRRAEERRRHQVHQGAVR